MTTATTADRLLDAQVRWVLGQTTDDRLLEVIAREVDAALDVAAHVRVGEVVPPGAVIEVVTLLLTRGPSSPAVAGAVRSMADQFHAGPQDQVTPADLVQRDDLAAVIDAGLTLTPLLEQHLERLTESPLTGQLATRFISRLVVDVLEANRSLTKKIPGVGSLVSFGTNAATRMVGAADKQVQAILGGEMGGRGTAIAVRRLNSVVMSTIQDPSFRDALLEVWDGLADEPIDGPGDAVERADVRALADAVHTLVADGARTPPVRAFLDAWTRTLLQRYQDDTVAELLDQLGLERDDVLTIATALVPPIVQAAITEGRLERLVRDRLAPFYASAEVSAILGT